MRSPSLWQHYGTNFRRAKLFGSDYEALCDRRLDLGRPPEKRINKVKGQEQAKMLGAQKTQGKTRSDTTVGWSAQWKQQRHELGRKQADVDVLLK